MVRKFFEHIFRQEHGTFVGCSVGGWIISMRLLLASPGVWAFLTGEFIAKTIIGLIISFLSGCLGVLAKDCIKWVKTIKKKDKDHEQQKAA